MILKPCPCGRRPEPLLITTTSQGRKWAAVTGSCCDSWGIDFYTAHQSGDVLQESATEAWNNAPRCWEYGEK
jgi:hypothetical protein